MEDTNEHPFSTPDLRSNSYWRKFQRLDGPKPLLGMLMFLSFAHHSCLFSFLFGTKQQSLPSLDFVSIATVELCDPSTISQVRTYTLLLEPTSICCRCCFLFSRSVSHLTLALLLLSQKFLLRRLPFISPWILLRLLLWTSSLRLRSRPPRRVANIPT